MAWPPTQSDVGVPKATRPFRLETKYTPYGDQPKAIEALMEGLERGDKFQTLLGITGSGKTFTVANVIAKHGRPSLILAPNKTLAAQLYQEFKSLFPDNAVEYFVSYYDYYQPEAYVAASDTFIEKDSQINEAIDRMRHAATRSLLERNDVIIIASVSCIYGIGSSEAYEGMILQLALEQEVDRQDILRKLVELQYERNEVDFHRGTFRARGDVIDVFPPYEEDRAIRIELFGDEVDGIFLMDPLRGQIVEKLDKVTLYPASHYVTPKEKLERAMGTIRTELVDHLAVLKSENKLLEAQRLEQRTNFDLELIEQIGRCKGIENYSRHLSGRAPGEPPPTLLEYFPKDWLIIIDESHMAIPQVGGMFKGDRARKTNLVEHGFRLPSAMDNRPLKFDEFEAMINKAILVSATPGKWEIEHSPEPVEQLLRPTGLLDPTVEVVPAAIQVDDCLDRVRTTVAKGLRVLVTVLTKRMAQELTDFLEEHGVRARYLHSDIDTLERTEILRELRLGSFDVLVGINLLREGLDLPEVGTICILDADKEGFLRNRRSLIQTIGRAARNAEGHVVLYGDRITDSMRASIDETERRRAYQDAYNKEHGITPTTVVREIGGSISEMIGADHKQSRKRPGGKRAGTARQVEQEVPHTADIPKLIVTLRKEMKAHATKLEFEKAAELRDRIIQLEEMALAL